MQDGVGENVSYKRLMPAMRIGRNRLQRVLNCIEENVFYFKVKHGYVLTVSNITSGVDKSKRFMYWGAPAYYFHIDLFNKTEEKCVKKCKNCWWCDEINMLCYMQNPVNYVKEDDWCSSWDDRLKQNLTLDEWINKDPHVFVYAWEVENGEVSKKN